TASTNWYLTNRHLSIPTQRGRRAAKLLGHYAYYGITRNSTHSAGTSIKSPRPGGNGWNVGSAPNLSLGRNSCRSWRAIRFPRPRSCIAMPLSANLSHEEPDAVVLRVRICGG